MNIDQIKKVTVFKNPYQAPTDSFLIEDKAAIKVIIECLNNSKRRPAKFIAKYKIEIQYTDKTKLYLINETWLNIEGLTYEMDCDLGKKIDALK